MMQNLVPPVVGVTTLDPKLHSIIYSVQYRGLYSLHPSNCEAIHISTPVSLEGGDAL